MVGVESIPTEAFPERARPGDGESSPQTSGPAEELLEENVKERLSFGEVSDGWPGNVAAGATRPANRLGEQLREAYRQQEHQRLIVRLLSGDLEQKLLTVPDRLDCQVRFREAALAYRMSFYPGARGLDAHTVGFATDRYFEVLRFLAFAIA